MKKTSISFTLLLFSNLSFAEITAPFFCTQSIHLNKIENFKIITKKMYTVIGEGYSKQLALEELKAKFPSSLVSCKVQSKKLNFSWCYQTNIGCHSTYEDFDWNDLTK
ncbi:MAG: hypothetical protein AB7I27_14315 [Bacteriovoracaceae bacterium]